MIVSWNWLKEYVDLDMTVEDLEYRLMMSGLNHEGTSEVGDDVAIDLEVTSNRPDCLGHIGVAREIAVLYQQPLRLPAAEPTESSKSVDDLTKVRIECPKLCSRYTARVICGVRVGPSPHWLADRLQALGIRPINNIVDITNYVLMETGQPLHAFDFAALRGHQIIVREAKPGEHFEAISHKSYTLEKGMCVIADAERPVALGGVMGGADSEVSDATQDVLVESAMFDPISIRTTARRLVLHSDSSYRFERGPDPEGVDWASRRCCELILEIAGGELATGVVDVGSERAPRKPIVLRLDQVKRVLGIAVDHEEIRRILNDLGNHESKTDDRSVEVLPPSWRQDLQREIDLVEEVARIHGYDEIPEDVQVPMAVSSRSDDDRVLEKVRHVLTACGFDEAMTASVVDEETSSAFSPWNDNQPLATETPLLRGATWLRRSLVPSLLAARRTNESLANPIVELFEVANVYLPRGDELPLEEKMITLASGKDYFYLKGAIETLLSTLNDSVEIDVANFSHDLLTASRSGALEVDGKVFGYLGEVSEAGREKFGLRGPASVAEIKLTPLVELANLVPRHEATSPYPCVERDLNFDVPESVRWSELARIVRQNAGDHLEEIRYLETYRDKKRLGVGIKSLVLKVVFRKTNDTLTGEEADAARDQIVAACEKQLNAKLRA